MPKFSIPSHASITAQLQNPVAMNAATDYSTGHAKLLHARVVSSCVMSMLTVLFPSLIMLGNSDYQFVSIWLLVGSGMVLLNYLYAKLAGRSGINDNTSKKYIQGYNLVWAGIGTVWSVFACLYTNFDSEVTLFTGAAIITSITVGGLMPSSPHRPSYVITATCSLVPYGLYVFFFAGSPMYPLGAAILCYYAFCLIVSKRAEINTLSAINAQYISDLLFQVSKANNEKNRFLSASSHDLAQPHHAIGYYIDEIAKDADQHCLNTIKKLKECWEAQGQILKSISELTHIESGMVTPNYQSVELSSLIQRVLVEFDQIETRNLRVQAQLPEITVYSDSTLITRVMRNLISNAIKFSNDGGKLILGLEADQEHVFFKIQDFGLGIDPQLQGLIFHDYAQLEDSNRVSEKGLGLGLAIVKNFCELLDIEITLDSDLGQGSTFTLAIPSKQDKHPRMPMITETDNALCTALLIDPDASSAQAKATFLSSRGYQLLNAATIAAGVEISLLTQHQLSILIINISHSSIEEITSNISTAKKAFRKDIPIMLLFGPNTDVRSLKNDQKISLLDNNRFNQDFQSLFKSIDY